MSDKNLKKRRLLGSEGLSGKTLSLLAGMVVTVGVVAADAKSANAKTQIEPTIEASVAAIQKSPGAIILVPALASGEQTAAHYSHRSHNSHSSHQSHYSSRGY